MENMEKGSAAVARYRAMAGQIKELPPAAARRAKTDRKRYAEEYLPKRGKGLGAPLKMMRFAVDVCGLSLSEAAWAVRKDMETQRGQPWEPQGESTGEMALKVYRASGDVLEGLTLARFYGWLSFTPDYWNEVRADLRQMTVAAEATGIENWQHAAE